jgi:hypothetical protein
MYWNTDLILPYYTTSDKIIIMSIMCIYYNKINKILQHYVLNCR